MANTVAKYQKYDEYKDSGVEWLGKIPSHWECFTGKRLFSTVRKPAYGSDEQLAASQKYGVIPQKMMMELNDSKVMLALKGTESFRHVEKNNYVISLRSFEGGIEYSQYTGCVSPAYTVLQSKKVIDYSYFKYLFKSTPFIAALQSTTDSLRDGKSISYEQFGGIDLPSFKVEEQSNIANFLDHETAKIDSLIEKQQKLIELLQEKRQAVISHAVTKGLNPDATMKDSGVEWLGQVPEHWKVAPIKRIIHLMEQGKSPECENIPATSAQWGVLKTSCVNNGIFQSQQNKALPENAKPHLQYHVKAGDVLMSRASGSIKLIGSVALVPDDVQENLLLSDKIFRIHLTPACDARFFTFLMATPCMRTLIERAISGAEGMANNITKTAILEFISPIPTLKEQIDLVNYISKKVKAFDSLTLKSNDAIQLLQERRTALISVAVTGKIDVRNWQAPDEAVTAHTV